MTTNTSANLVFYVQVVRIYFLYTQSDSKLLSWDKEPIPRLPEAAVHGLSIHHLPPFLPCCSGVLSSTDTQPPCTHFCWWNAVLTCSRTHYHLIPATARSFPLAQISCKNWSKPPMLKIATSADICHHRQTMQLLYTGSLVVCKHTEDIYSLTQAFAFFLTGWCLKEQFHSLKMGFFKGLQSRWRKHHWSCVS